MLHPVYRLATSDLNPPTIASMGFKSWRRHLLLPRQLCVFESIACEGLAWHEHREFARLQARRLAPFLECGVNAVIRSGRLMLWFWDRRELDPLIEHANSRLRNYLPTVETLFLPLPRTSGQFALHTPDGLDCLTLDHGAILQSQWQAGAGTAVQWRQYPWAFELAGASQHLSKQPGPRWSAAATKLASPAIVAGATAYMLFHAGTYLGTSAKLEELEREADQADQRISMLASAGQELRTQTRWLAAYRHAAASVDLEALISALTPELARHGVALKEFELRNEQVRIVVVSAGGDIDLPALLHSLTTVEGISNVQLRDNTELRQASFNLQVAGLRKLLGPAG